MINCWKPKITELPKELVSSTVERLQIGRYFYPYWLFEFRVSMRALFLFVKESEKLVAVNGIDGGVSYSPPRDEVIQVEALESDILEGKYDCSQMDEAKAAEHIRQGMSKIGRALCKVRVEKNWCRLVYREIALWEVRYSEGNALKVVALDTLSGRHMEIDNDKRFIM